MKKIEKEKHTICASFSGDMYHDFPVGTSKEKIYNHFASRAKKRGVDIQVIQDLETGDYVVE